MTTKTVKKHLFVWLGSFLFGGFGVDRFMRGQIGMGICKLLFNWATFGIWSFVDWIVALVKAYSCLLYTSALFTFFLFLFYFFRYFPLTFII